MDVLDPHYKIIPVHNEIQGGYRMCQSHQASSRCLATAAPQVRLHANPPNRVVSIRALQERLGQRNAAVADSSSGLITWSLRKWLPSTSVPVMSWLRRPGPTPSGHSRRPIDDCRMDCRNDMHRNLWLPIVCAGYGVRRCVPRMQHEVITYLPTDQELPPMRPPVFPPIPANFEIAGSPTRLTTFVLLKNFVENEE